MHLSASSIIGDDVKNAQGDDLGKIEDLMIDTDTGQVKYGVVTFGGFLGMGNKLFAVPLETLTLDHDDKCFVMHIDKERLESAPGFDKDNWPNTADPKWQQSIRSHYHLA